MENNEKHLKTRKILRIVGIITLIIGISLQLIAIFNIGKDLFMCAFIGLPILFVGMVCCIFGFMGAVNKYAVNENAPINKEYSNYMIKGTRDEVTNTAASVANAMKDTRTIVCNKCGSENPYNAQYCNHCGEPLSIVCECGEINPPKSNFCNKCGKKL